MIEIKTILVPIDFGDCCIAAVRYAKQLAEKFQGRIHLVYVIPDSALILPEAILPPVAAPDIGALQGHAASGLDGLVAREGLPAGTTHESRFGSPADEIIACAKDKRADLIVIGTHGRGALAHFLLGSVAERVVRHAPCPVLTVRHPG
jgi:universal stress protein A